MRYHYPVLTAGSPHGEPDASAAAALAALLDGTRTLEDLYGALLVRGFAVLEIQDALKALDSRGMIAEAGPPAGSLSPADRERFQEQIRFLSWLRAPHGSRLELGLHLSAGIKAQALLRSGTVRVFGLGRAPERLLEMLEAYGVGRLLRASAPEEAEEDGAGDGDAAGDGPRLLNICCADRHDPAFAQALNRACVGVGAPVVFYRFGGTEVECGPLVIPRATPCYRCYTTRRTALLTPLERVWMERAGPAGAPAVLPGLEMLALDALKFLARLDEPVLQGRLWRFSLQSGEARVHPILRLPRCPECGAADERPPVKIWADAG